MTIYPSDIPDALPWENEEVSITLEQCTSHHKKLRDDLAILELPTKSQKILQILLEYLGKFIGAYRTIGPTTYCFIHLMRMRRAQVMGLNKWVDVEKRVSKAYAISMFNFKEGLKRKMLKMQYIKHPRIAYHLYDIFLAAYGRFPWNDEVTHYFVRFFYAEFFKT